MKKTSVALIALAASLALSACSKTIEPCGTRQPTEFPAVKEETLVESESKDKNLSETIAEEDFQTAHLNFMTSIIQEAQQENPKENICISAYSIEQALGMLSLGTNGNTKAQIETAVGIPLDSLHTELKQWRLSQPDDKECFVKTANALFINEERNDFKVLDSFYQSASNFYHAESESYPFSEGPGRINQWADENTDGMIPVLFDKLEDNMVMVLANASLFEAKWKNNWEDYTMTFKDANGKKQETDKAMLTYLDGYFAYKGNEVFMKPYANEQYAFVGILPKESADKFVTKMEAETLSCLTDESFWKETETRVYMPEFTYDTDLNLTAALESVGVTDIFSPKEADFSALAETSPDSETYISQSIHKTHIEVDKEGTKAAAVTAFAVTNDACAIQEPPKYHDIYLDRPFVYMIYDTKEKLPLFIGVVNSLE